MSSLVLTPVPASSIVQVLSENQKDAQQMLKDAAWRVLAPGDYALLTGRAYHESADVVVLIRGIRRLPNEDGTSSGDHFEVREKNGIVRVIHFACRHLPDPELAKEALVVMLPETPKDVFVESMTVNR
jgi:hypothetical protein